MRRDLFQEVGVVIVGEVNPANDICVMRPLVYEVLRYFLEKKVKHNFHSVCLYWKFIFDQDKRKDPIAQSCFPFLSEPLRPLSVRNFFFSEGVLNRQGKAKFTFYLKPFKITKLSAPYWVNIIFNKTLFVCVGTVCGGVRVGG